MTDRRRIDPETGKARRAVPDASEAAPSDVSGEAGQPTVEQVTTEGADELATAKAEALDLADQLARRNADVYNVQQEYNAFVRRSRTEAAAHRQAGVQDVAEALLGVLDEIELARQHGDLTGPFASIAEKLESTLAQRFEVVRYGAVGEEFDPAVHEALMHTTDTEATATTVTQVLQPGYRAGERVLRAARVAVSSPE
ncbi:nucleotide exchange factor GrpE [Georgenia subflava]|uniref:Protein GrpE n=1 Tax=Georgenia subflava TaxID=1622177 RepID=A0A6N7EME0_9MICO|nr:nucleotide exchange factor GrpE [Georgenia subflava]